MCKPEAACTPSLVACVRESPGAADAVTCRRLAPPLDAAVLADVLTPSECHALRAEAEALGYSFWSPGAHRHNSCARAADTQAHSPDGWGRAACFAPRRDAT